MKANELRIGNWVNDQGLNLQVGMINSEIVKSMEPIPLTEEWLIKFGFKRDELNGYYYPTWRKFIPIYKRGHYYNFNGISLSCNDFEYVHQLQNLYFTLTGEELTYNTTTTN